MDRKLSMKNSIMMEDFKLKFLGLINKQNQGKIPSMGLNPELLNPEEYKNDCEVKSEAGQSTEGEIIPDQDILESIELVYYNSDGNFDSCRHELNKLPNKLNCKDIEKYYKKLKQQQQVVSKKVLQLILQKQSACNDEFDKILKLQEQLDNIISICRSGRYNLNLAKKQFTTASLSILANYNKRKIIEKLLNNLNTIKTMQRTEDRLQELLMEENYPGAISLLLECQSAAQTYKHFNCIAALNGKLQDTLEQTEETLDVTLARICRQFDEKTYSSVREAYRLLGKTQTAVDQLHMHFTAAIHNTAFTVVHSHVGGDPKKQYKQLCQCISPHNFINCLIELSKSMWKILISYYQVLNWHNKDDKKCFNDNQANDNREPEMVFNKQYVKQKLETGMIKMWHDVEIKMSIFLVNSNLSSFKFEQFVQVLGIVNKLMEVGSELCGSKSENLQESIRKQCLSYFSHHHSLRLDELKIFLEHDGWELCPVKSTFVATQLQEFKSLKSVLKNCKSWCSIDDSNPNSDYESSLTSGWLQRFIENETSPFDESIDETVDEDILANLDDESNENISDDSEDDDINENDDKKSSRKKSIKALNSSPMVTNTTLSVMRICGRYLQMSKLLNSISVIVIQNMIQFFELCLFTVHSFFTSDLQITSDSLYNSKLKLTLNHIKENLMNESNDDSINENDKNHHIRNPQMSSIINLSSKENCYGLGERVVAVESLIFLGKQYENIQNYLKQLISNNPERGFLNLFYTQTVPAATELRKPVYMAVVAKAFDINNIMAQMNRVNWEVRDVMSQHSGYVDTILSEVKTLAKQMDEISHSVPLSTDVRFSLWENVAHLITHALVEGFANAKKCSNGGRGLMQLDFTQLSSKFAAITSIRPMPHSDYVEAYIKAYYIPENNLEEWVKKQKVYSAKQLIGLISCACQNNKKSRQRLISVVEEQRPNR